MQDINAFYSSGIIAVQEMEVSPSLLVPIKRHLESHPAPDPELGDLGLRPSLSLSINRILQAFHFLHRIHIEGGMPERVHLRIISSEGTLPIQLPITTEHCSYLSILVPLRVGEETAIQITRQVPGDEATQVAVSLSEGSVHGLCDSLPIFKREIIPSRSCEQFLVIESRGAPCV